MRRTPLEREAHAAVADAGAGAAADDRPHWAALRARIEPRDCLTLFAGSDAPARFYWERPAKGRSVATIGSAHAIEAGGDSRFRAAADAARELFAAVHVAGDPGPPRSGALLVGGFAFAAQQSPDPLWCGFPAGRLTLPEVLFVRHGGDMWCTVVRRIEAGADTACEAAGLVEALQRRLDTPTVAHRCAAHTGAREAGTPGATRPGTAAGTVPAFRAKAERSHADYCARVDAALNDIAAGDIEKVVLARAVRLQREAPLDTASLLRDLRTAYPTCTHFAVAHADGVFLGATPEHLVRLDGNRVATAAVAGSAPRGRDLIDDERLGRELLESKKEQAEHAVVVRALREGLAACCDDLHVPESPRLLRLGAIQHLETPIRATLRNGETILGLVERLHPTPAVGGAPRAAAQAWIARNEDLDRGWYAGPVGFVDSEGGGDFCVALRSALIRGAEARLYAGAGIVAGSLPQAELRETRLKLRAMLAPLLEI
jgi:isochorismate synthase